MYDVYRPNAAPICPLCGRALLMWRGTDGPCANFLWEQGSPSPVDQDVFDEVPVPSDFSGVRLPATFDITSNECGDHPPIEAVGYTENGVWTQLELARPRPFTRSGTVPAVTSPYRASRRRSA